jgi:hypothetical protein
LSIALLFFAGLIIVQMVKGGGPNVQKELPAPVL